MRLWSIHPSYLDRQGLIALWRESLLAQKVMQGATKGYTRHPQLCRFKECGNPVGAIATYLRPIADHAEERGYAFNKAKIARQCFSGSIPITDGQLHYEFNHLLGKLKVRDPERFERLKHLRRIDVHPLFHIIPGPVASWERQLKPSRS
jgi:hypothetical protein